MAIGDDIGRGWATGRMIGDDISRVRYTRGESKIRDKYAELAEREGKSLGDYLPQIEQELTELGRGMFGADRRGVIGADRQSMSGGALGRLRGDVLTQSERAAGQKALAGDQQGARMQRAQGLYGLGRFDDGQQQQIAGDTIGATTGAIGADGIYDPTKGANAMSGVTARYGDQAGAERNQQAGTTFRLQAANAIGGQLATAFQNPDTANADQIVGLYEGFKEKVPELAKTELRVGPDGVWNIYANGSAKATGSFNPKDPGDQKEFMDMMSSFSKDPSQVLGQYQQARLQQIADSKARDKGIEDKFMDARIDAVAALTKDVGIPSELASKLVGANSSSSSSGGQGWQLQEIGEDASTYMIQKGGNVYVVKTNVPADPTKGQVGGPVQVFEADGVTPVPASVLNASERREISSMTTGLATELAKGNMRAKVEAVNAQLNALGSIESQYRGGTSFTPSGASRSGGGARSERNNNPGNIEDRGQFKGMPGYLGSDGRFARFESPEAGQQAQHRQLQRYMQGKTTGQKLTTVADIIGTWSPQSDPTNQAGSTDNYAAYVAQRLGIDPNAQLTDSDIPRLAQAMSEFESGNTARGVLGASPGGNRRQANIGAAAPAAPATPVAAAPTARARLTPEYTREAAGSLNALADEYREARSTLERFEAEQGRGTTAATTAGSGAMAMGAGAIPTTRQAYRDPTVQRVADQLRAKVADVEQRLQAAEADLRSNTGALRRQTAQDLDDKRANQLAERYDPGMADFFRQMQ